MYEYECLKQLALDLLDSTLVDEARILRDYVIEQSCHDQFEILLYDVRIEGEHPSLEVLLWDTNAMLIDWWEDVEYHHWGPDDATGYDEDDPLRDLDGDFWGADNNPANDDDDLPF